MTSSLTHGRVPCPVLCRGWDIALVNNNMSKKGTLNRKDWNKIGKNALIFLAPSLLIYLLSVQQALQDGFAWSDFAITTLTLGAIFGWAISTAIDFLKKLGTKTA